MACHPQLAVRFTGERRMERETGIEPATNSLEGCDSTTELLPPSGLATLPASAAFRLRRFAALARQAFNSTCPIATHTASASVSELDFVHLRGCPPPPLRGFGETGSNNLRCWPANRSSRSGSQACAAVGGEGRVRTSVAARAAGLQPAAIDHSATSPEVLSFNDAAADRPR
jgi:hypothetical protein